MSDKFQIQILKPCLKDLMFNKLYFCFKNVNIKQIPNSNFKRKDLKFNKSLHFQRSNKRVFKFLFEIFKYQTNATFKFELNIYISNRSVPLEKQ